MPSDVVLKPAASRLETKDGAERLYWHVLFQGKTAGHAFIDIVVHENGEMDPSITVELNRASRGRGIGTLAFRLACEASNLKRVYASIRKTNLASRIAVERAGFQFLSKDSSGSLTYEWVRQPDASKN